MVYMYSKSYKISFSFREHLGLNKIPHPMIVGNMGKLYQICQNNNFLIRNALHCFSSLIRDIEVLTSKFNKDIVIFVKPAYFTPV